MSPRREHRQMSEEEQCARGAAAQGRHAEGTFQSGSRFSRGNATAAHQAGCQPSSQAGYQDAGQPLRTAGPQTARQPYSTGDPNARVPRAERPRTVTRSQAEDVNRYRQMRQERDGGGVLRRRRHAGGPDCAHNAYGNPRDEYGEQAGGANLHQRREFNPRRALKVTKRVLVGTLVALLAFAVLITVRMNLGVSLETRLALRPVLPGQPFYMLLVGTDKDAYREETGATGGVYRTDSIILARVDQIGRAHV